MKVAVFGTGKVFLFYWNDLKHMNIACLIDNDKSKIGTYIKGKKVVSPEQLVKNREVDYVIIASISYYEEMKKQLEELGLPENTIYHYLQLKKFYNEPLSIYSVEKKYDVERWLQKNDKNKKVLMISHQLSLTGAPIALLNMAVILKKIGCSVLYAGMENGELEKELKLKTIDFINNWKFINSECQKKFVKEFDMIVICTVGLYKLVESYEKLDVPILWWIHEAESAYKQMESYDYRKNVNVFCVGNRAKRSFETFFKGKKANILQYYVPEKKIKNIKKPLNKKDKVCFGIIGTLSERKAQDILFKAVSELLDDSQEQIEILVVGTTMPWDKSYWEKQSYLLEKLKNVRLVGEKTQDEISKLYEEIDVLVCPSRDDPMPIVVTEAMMYKKVCIISDNVGQAEFIKHGYDGFIFKNEDISQLASQIQWVIEHREKLPIIGERARKIYDNNFNEMIQKQKLREFIKTL